MEILSIDKISKSFGTKQVLKDVSFTVEENSIFGFVGRNGAGKTTTMKIVLGLLKGDGGSVSICGEPVTYGQTATNRFVGYLPDVPEFYPYMKAREYLKLCGEITGLSGNELKSRIDELLTLVGLGKEKGRIGGYSRGMKQRLGIAQALIGKPKLLICDEPTSALDPLGRHEILDILLEAKEQTSVLFSTHILSDVEKISDHVAFLEGGEVKLTGAISDLIEARGDTGVRLILGKASDVKKVTAAFPDSVCEGDSIEFKSLNPEQEAKVLEFLAKERIAVNRFERKESDLEDMFLEVVG